jgi:tRNA(Ile)-lysidine synthase
VNVLHSAKSPIRDCVELVYAALSETLVKPELTQLNSREILLAVSGGPDSMCMADAVLHLQSSLNIKPIVAHLNHGLRGKAADDDAEYVRQFAVVHNLGFISTKVDVSDLSSQLRLSIEVAARLARYRFLAATAEAIGARIILLAHTADDQAETILLRLLRGTGISGLRGMQSISFIDSEYQELPARLALVRPLLSISRRDIECYCTARSLEPRLDATNNELHHMRNRVRHELLPLLEQYNPGIRKLLTRLAQTAQTDMEVIDYATHTTYASLQSSEVTHPFSFDRTAWRSLPVGLQRAVLRECVRNCIGNTTDLKFAGIEEARKVLNSAAQTGEIAILSNLRVIVLPRSFHFVRLL